ncbi:MAG: hypothetical protein ACRD2T_11800, partial [Thermoanaerobaculia bacterium]
MPIYNRLFVHPGPAGLQINATLLAQHGPILPVEVAVPSSLAQLLTSQNQPVPPPVAGLALIDT